MTRQYINDLLQECGIAATDHQINQIYGTALVESNNRNIRQYGNGPALGYFQCEPATRKDIVDNYIKYHPVLRERIERIVGSIEVSDKAFLDSPDLQVIFCFLHYRRFKAWGTTVHEYAVCWKNKYNTIHGAGSVAEYEARYWRDQYENRRKEV